MSFEQFQYLCEDKGGAGRGGIDAGIDAGWDGFLLVGGLEPWSGLW
jgi:hypothetical protein